MINKRRTPGANICLGQCGHCPNESEWEQIVQID